MPTLVELVRGYMSALDDEELDDDRIVKSLNDAQSHIVSLALQRESAVGIKRTIRALDELRSSGEFEISQSNSMEGGKFYRGEVSFPDNFRQLQHAEYIYDGGDGVATLLPLNLDSRHLVRLGQARPHAREGYYIIRANDDGSLVEVFVHNNPSDNEVRLFWIQDPTELTTESEAPGELPDRLQWAIIYYAAYLVTVERQDAEHTIQQMLDLYNRQIQSNLF